MKEPHRKGLASHPGLESCDGFRKEPGEALTGEDTGREIELRNHKSGEPTQSLWSEGETQGGVKGEPPWGSAESKALRMCGSSLHGNREIPAMPDGDEASGRSEKATNRNADAHIAGKSHGSIVPKKPPNNGKPAEEVVEGRDPTKRNAQQTAMPRTQSQIKGSNENRGRH